MKKTLFFLMFAATLMVSSCNNDDGDETDEQPVTAEKQVIADEKVLTTDDESQTVHLSKGKSGDLRINLQWYCKTDLNLHVIDPCGNEIYFSKRKATCQGGTGILDLDANAIGTTSRPQENIYWLKPTPGTYTIKVVCFKWRERTQNPISYNISIVDKNGRVEKRGTIAKGQTITVAKHIVIN